MQTGAKETVPQERSKENRPTRKAAESSKTLKTNPNRLKSPAREESWFGHTTWKKGKPWKERSFPDIPWHETDGECRGERFEDHQVRTTPIPPGAENRTQSGKKESYRSADEHEERSQPDQKIRVPLTLKSFFTEEPINIHALSVGGNVRGVGLLGGSVGGLP